MKKFKNKNGITILEILVAISILVIVLMIIFTTYINTSRIYKEQSIKNKLQVNVEIAMKKIIDDIKKANEVSLGIPGTSYSTSTTSPYTKVVLRKPDFDDIGNEIDCSYTYYELNTGKITKITADCSGNITSNSSILENLKTGATESRFNFFPITTPLNLNQVTSIKIKLIVEELVRGKSIQVELNSQAKLRNKR